MHSHHDTESRLIQTSPTKKTWVTPELQDQSVKSITEGAKTSNPSEFDPTNGPVS